MRALSLSHTHRREYRYVVGMKYVVDGNVNDYGSNCGKVIKANTDDMLFVFLLLSIVEVCQLLTGNYQRDT